MKFTLPTLIALFTALPAFAFKLPPLPPYELSQNLTIEIVTPWSDATMDGPSAGAVTGDEVKVDDHMYHRLNSFSSFEKGATIAGAYFGLWRESWKEHELYLVCGVRVQDDLNIPILHVVFEGDGKDWSAKGNGHEDKVVIMCDKMNSTSLEPYGP